MKVLITKEEQQDAFEMLRLAMNSGKARMIPAFNRSGAKVQVIAVENVDGDRATLIPVATLITDTEDVNWGERAAKPALAVVQGGALKEP